MRVDNRDDLARLVGRRVRVAGVFSGPAKMGNYVRLAEGAGVFLFDSPASISSDSEFRDSRGRPLAYGDTMVAEGVLKHFEPHGEPKIDEKLGIPYAVPPRHFYITGPTVRLADQRARRRK